ncbi:hypothetical protein CN189_00435 [Sinorhizobium meliloti]|nr:hypothetical protein CN189_00435 [Sinorhizobium meliloti]
MLPTMPMTPSSPGGRPIEFFDGVRSAKAYRLPASAAATLPSHRTDSSAGARGMGSAAAPLWGARTQFKMCVDHTAASQSSQISRVLTSEIDGVRSERRGQVAPFPSLHSL